MKIRVQFSWIGPPPQGIIGQDTDGLDAFLRQLGTEQFSEATHELTFFCLREFKPIYQRHFDSKAVQVYAVEDFLQDIIQADDCASRLAGDLLDLMPKFLSYERNTLRDRVTVKNLVHFLIGFSLGGYVFDSNISPAGTIHLPENDQFYLVCFAQGKPLKLCDIDIFAFYSPRGSLIAYAAFENYYLELKSIETYSPRSPYYYFKCAYFAVKSLALAWIKTGGSHWQAEEDKSLELVNIRALGIQKRYNNTHKHHAMATYDLRSFYIHKLSEGAAPSAELLAHPTEELAKIYEARFGKIVHSNYHDAFSKVRVGDVEGLHLYLNSGLNLTMRVTVPNGTIIGDSLLHYAVEHNQQAICTLLLEQKGIEALYTARRETKVFMGTYHIIETPLELAQRLGWVTIATLLERAMEQYKATLEVVSSSLSPGIRN